MITTGNDTGNREIMLIKYNKTYFYERCLGGPKSSGFWPTIKPFLSNKSNNCKKDIILEEDNNIINDQTEVSEIFNNFFYKCS